MPPSSAGKITPKYPSSAIILRMRSGISLFSRSRSFAIGLTSASTNSRTDRRINSCSGVTSGIVMLLRGSLADQDRALVLEHLLAALVVTGGAELDDAAIGPR